MVLKEDCSDFGYLKNDITGIGEGEEDFWLFLIVG
jgi:hypothetical protein